MKKYDIEMVPKKVVKCITCDICGKDFYDPLDSQEFLTFSKTCGYASSIGEGKSVSIDMCEECLVEKLGDCLKIEE
jgi:hypothetical protein